MPWPVLAVSKALLAPEGCKATRVRLAPQAKSRAVLPA
jgi:hypothetical protein